MEVNDYESQEREKRFQSRKTATIPPNIFFVDLFWVTARCQTIKAGFLAVGRRFFGREKGRRNAPKFETQEEQEFPLEHLDDWIMLCRSVSHSNLRPLSSSSVPTYVYRQLRNHNSKQVFPLPPSPAYGM